MPTIRQVSTIQIHINSEPREIQDRQSVADLLRELGLDRQACAVEVNLELVPKARHATHQLAAGDRLEIVSLVGGG